jgi:hypothetical protein
VWRHRYAAGETFVQHGYEVAPIGRPETADFLRDHHYLHKLPANRFRFGLHRGADLVGIAVLGPGMPHTLGALFPDLEPAESVVLDRFALLDDVKALGDTWFLARVFALLRSGGIEAVATFSDPWPVAIGAAGASTSDISGRFSRRHLQSTRALRREKPSTSYTPPVSWSTAER